MSQSNREIAIVGLSCRYPGARGPLELWENCLAARRQFRRIPDCRFPLADYFDPNARDKTYASRVAVMDWTDFDYEAHGISKATFDSTDAVHWLALEVAIEAMADAGYRATTVAGSRAGVVLGNTLNGEQSRTNGIRLRWPFIEKAIREAAKRSGMSAKSTEHVLEESESALKSVFPDLNEDSLTGSMASAIAGRIASWFGFEGGGYVVDGACASSLLAIATASDKLERGELDLVLAGGVDISLDPLEMIGFAGAHALTRGEMSVYDRRASGFIPGEGCGVIVMKRLADAERDRDTIHAVIRGWGISSDGRGAIAAPSSIGQSKAILRAYEKAGYSPRELDFIEGHGTGTPVGDRAELEAVYSAIRADRDGGPSRCGITSLKSLIGHTKAASGIAGLIKATIAVNQRVLPPTAACTSPHVLFDVTAPRLYPLTEGETRAPVDRLRAGVSGMGFGGINCHITLESYEAGPSERFAPELENEKLLASAQESEVFLIGASSKAELIEKLVALAVVARDASIAELTDLSAKLAAEVGALPYRAAIVASLPEALVSAIEKLKAALLELPGEEITFTAVDRRAFARFAEAPARVGMVFPGQGSQQINIGKTLIKRHAWAAELLADADRWMEEVGSPRLSPLAYRSTPSAKKEELDRWKAELTETSIAQPAICLYSLLWRRFLAELGLSPVVVGGHSLGELSAFAAAGAFDEEALIKLAARRGRAMSSAQGSAGTMASLMCSRERAEAILSQVAGYAVVANINGPAQTVISGEVPAINEAIRIAEAESIGVRRLSVSNAFHSRLVENAAEMLRADSPVKGSPRSLSAEIILGATGTPVLSDIEMSAHFAQQVLDRVDFVSMIDTIGKKCDLLIEVGPSRVLSGMASEVLGTNGVLCLPIESAAGSDRDLNSVIAALFVHGHNLAWTKLFDGRLVRPFIDPRERKFFVNPCERSFAPAAHAPEQSILATQWTKNLGLPAAFLEDYLERRADVLTEVIRADLQQAAIDAKIVLPESFHAVPPALAIVPPSAAADSEAEDDHEVEEDPRESRPSAIARQDARIEKEIIKTVADRLELDPALISADARLTDDLGLPLADALEAVEDIAEISKVEGQVNAAALVHASIREIAGAIRMARHVRPIAALKKPVSSRARSAQEIRSYAAGIWEMAPLFERTGRRGEDWGSARVVILADGENSAANALSRALDRLGAMVFVLPFSAAAGLERGRFSHTFVMLPAASHGSLRADIERLHAASRAALVSSPLKRKKNNALIFVERGFGGVLVATASGSPTGSARSSSRALGPNSSLAFARSLHLERPELRVRVVGVDPALSAEEIARCSIREAESSARWSAAHYDASLLRHRPRLERQDRSLYEARALTWSSDRLAIVTGGAEGIAAECMLAFAEATGIRVAILSRPDETSEPDPARRVIIERNLARYESAGVVARNYVCDLTDAVAVSETCAQIRAELGAASLLVHGEGGDHAALAERVSVDEAYRLIAPRVLGAMHLIVALEDHPLRLFVALTSSAGVSGMREHAWEAFGAELTHALLREVEATAEVRSLAIAYDVWSPIGMGGRAGAVTEFNRFGADAIPARAGAECFVELMKHDPGCAEVVISARREEVSVGEEELVEAVLSDANAG